MSEVVIPEKSVGKDALGLSAGLMLRNAREAAGMHVAALAVSMKIPVKKLEALESDRLDLLHDAVFARALASSVCRTLKIDPEPVLAKLPSNTAPRLNAVERRINAPFHAAGDYTRLSLSTLLAKPQTLIVLTLLIGIAAVFLFPEKNLVGPTDEQSLQVPKVAEHSEPLATERSNTGSAAMPTVSASSSPVDAVVSGRTIVNPQAEPQQSASSSSPAEISRVLIDPSANTSGTIVFKAKAASWVKVVDSNGVVQLSKTLVNGEVVSASGAAPLSIVVGRADAVDVEVRGKAVSLTAVAKENVARFEVK